MTITIESLQDELFEAQQALREAISLLTPLGRKIELHELGAWMRERDALLERLGVKVTWNNPKPPPKPDPAQRFKKPQKLA